jgi:hypothetical protein
MTMWGRAPSPVRSSKARRVSIPYFPVGKLNRIPTLAKIGGPSVRNGAAPAACGADSAMAYL